MSARGRTNPAAMGLVITLVAAGALLGYTLVRNFSLAFPLTVEASVFGFITAMILSREEDRELRGKLVWIVLLGLALRGIVFLLVHSYFAPAFFAPDHLGYAETGRNLAMFWGGVGSNPLGTSRFQLYHYVNGAFSFVLGDGSTGAVVLNVFCGIWTIIVTFSLGRALFGPQVGLLAGALVAVFPSLVLWSVLNIRDALTGLLVAGTVLLAVRLSAQATFRRTAVFGVCVALLWGLRDYMAFLVVAGTGLGFFASVRPGRILRTLFLGTGLVLVTAFLAESVGILSKVQEGEAFRAAESIRRGMRVGAGSAFGVESGTDTALGALRYLPIGMAFILFAPFPWDVASRLQTFTLPEVLLWYGLIPFFLLGIRGAIRRRSVLYLLPLVVLLLVAASYGLVEGNVGTAYRHRSQIMPLAFLFISVGLLDTRGWIRDLSERGRIGRRSSLPLRTGSRTSGKVGS